MDPANDRRRYFVTSSLIGWAHSRMITGLEHILEHLMFQNVSKGVKLVKRCYLKRVNRVCIEHHI